ncbi:MAG: MBL fold metallo-hydrolase [Phycisphaerae bacterium]|nr:MBL fold metallo-hydrolase [Phycisphaerae bacterium]
MLIKNPPVDIADGLMMLGTNEYPIYLVTSQDQGTIFEGGIGADGPVVAEQVADLGIAADRVNQIVISHAHPDHVMAVPAFRSLFTHATVCASEAAAGTLLVEKAVGFFTKIDGMLTEALIKAGSIQERHRPQPLSELRIPVDRTLAEGDTVTVGKMKFNCLATPGHSDDSLSFHEPTRGILIIGDATGYYLPEPDYFWPNYFSDYGAYLESIKRLAALNANVVCLGHNAVIKGVETVSAFFDAAIAATQDWHARILQAAGDPGKDTGMIAADLGAEVYEKTQLLNLQFFEKNCELLTKQSVKYADKT